METFWFKPKPCKFHLKTPWSNQPESAILLVGSVAKTNSSGYAFFKGWFPVHLLNQNKILFQSLTMQNILLEKKLLFPSSTMSFMIKSFHHIKSPLLITLLSIMNIFTSGLLYICIINPLQIADMSMTILHFHFNRRALLKASRFLIPRPSHSLYLHTCSQLTQCIALLSSNPRHKNLL